MHFRRIVSRAFLLLAAISCAGGTHFVSTLPTSPAQSPFGTVANTRWIYLTGTQGTRFLTAIVSPAGAGPFPVVVLLHGADGLAAPYMTVAETIARAGFLVVVGCWQAGLGGTAGNRLCSEATPEREWVADPAANSGKELVELARSLPDARSDRVAIYGLSRGGHAALWAASTGADVRAVVVDAPAHAPAIRPAPPSTHTVVAGLKAPLLLMHGTSDASIPVQQSREYERAAKAADRQIEAVYFEGVGHLVSVAPSSSQTEALARAVAFLRRHLTK